MRMFPCRAEQVSHIDTVCDIRHSCQKLVTLGHLESVLKELQPLYKLHMSFIEGQKTLERHRQKTAELRQQMSRGEDVFVRLREELEEEENKTSELEKGLQRLQREKSLCEDARTRNKSFIENFYRNACRLVSCGDEDNLQSAAETLALLCCTPCSIKQSQ